MDNSLHEITNVRLKTNLHSLGASRTAANNRNNSDHNAAHETAKQFEALFIQTMLKSMRQASPGDPLAGSDQADMYRDMFDSQLSITMASNGGIGLARIIEQQISGTNRKPESQITIESAPTLNKLSTVNLSMVKQLWNNNSATTSPALSAAQDSKAQSQRQKTNWNNPAEFIQELRPAAINAAKNLGTTPEAVLAIAALETGWGKHIARKPDGQSSFNLFGIKAYSSANSNQPKVMAGTLEYTNGHFVQRLEQFRSYQTPTDSVSDFAIFIQQNPRYQQAIAKANDPEAFLREIHKAGYATDPDYADKAVNVMQKIKTLIQATHSVADK